MKRPPRVLDRSWWLGHGPCNPPQSTAGGSAPLAARHRHRPRPWRIITTQSPSTRARAQRSALHLNTYETVRLSASATWPAVRFRLDQGADNTCALHKPLAEVRGIAKPCCPIAWSKSPGSEPPYARRHKRGVPGPCSPPRIPERARPPWPNRQPPVPGSNHPRAGVPPCRPPTALAARHVINDAKRARMRNCERPVVENTLPGRAILDRPVLPGAADAIGRKGTLPTLQFPRAGARRARRTDSPRFS